MAPPIEIDGFKEFEVQEISDSEIQQSLSILLVNYTLQVIICRNLLREILVMLLIRLLSFAYTPNKPSPISLAPVLHCHHRWGMV